MKETDDWTKVTRPGFFGRRRDEKIAELNRLYGHGGWELRWYMADMGKNFVDSCKMFYEYSYYLWFMRHQEHLDIVCSYRECIDNAISNISSGIDYSKQEVSSTHIQDIAIRNVLASFGRKFEGNPRDNLLVIRSADTSGYTYSPGSIPFYDPAGIIQPSKRPKWAKLGSVEDFWQSNKFIYRKEQIQ